MLVAAVLAVDGIGAPFTPILPAAAQVQRGPGPIQPTEIPGGPAAVTADPYKGVPESNDGNSDSAPVTMSQNPCASQ